MVRSEATQRLVELLLQGKAGFYPGSKITLQKPLATVREILGFAQTPDDLKTEAENSTVIEALDIQLHLGIAAFGEAWRHLWQSKIPTGNIDQLPPAMFGFNTKNDSRKNLLLAGVTQALDKENSPVFLESQDDLSFEFLTGSLCYGQLFEIFACDATPSNFLYFETASEKENFKHHFQRIYAWGLSSPVSKPLRRLIIAGSSRRPKILASLFIAALSCLGDELLFAAPPDPDNFLVSADTLYIDPDLRLFKALAENERSITFLEGQVPREEIIRTGGTLFTDSVLKSAKNLLDPRLDLSGTFCFD